VASTAYDQISTIINRLEQLASLIDFADPVALAEAIEQVIAEIADPLPGNVGQLMALASAFSRAARDTSPVGTGLQAMSGQKLPGVWQGDAELTASAAVSDTSDLVGQTAPAFGAAASAIDAYADTLSNLENRRRDLSQQLYSASHDGPDIDIFGFNMPLDPMAWSGWLSSVRNLIFGSIDLYHDLQYAGDTLAGQFADVRSKAVAGAGLKAGMTADTVLLLATATINGTSLLGPGQLARLEKLMAAMSPADQARLAAVLRAAKSPLEQAYVLKALAAGHSLSQVITFAGEIRGQSSSWLTNQLSLAGTAGVLSYNGTPLVQSTQTECGSASIVAARVLTDPIFAYSLTTGPDGQSLTGSQFAARVAEVDAQTHDATNKIWPQSLGTSPFGVASGMNSGAADGAKYGVQWVDDTDSANAYPALQHAISSVDAGHPVPVLLAPTLDGMAHGTSLHYVLITGHSSGQLSIYDPEGGTISQIPDSDFLNGTMQAIDFGAPHVNAVIVPGR
jgi:hypothetical protein